MPAFLNLLREFIRPLSVLALLTVLLTGAAVSGILEAVWPGLGIRFTGGVAGWFRAIPDAYYQLTGTFGGIYMLAREFGKATKAKVDGQFGPTTRALPDEPEGGA